MRVPVSEERAYPNPPAPEGTAKLKGKASLREDSGSTEEVSDDGDDEGMADRREAVDLKIAGRASRAEQESIEIAQSVAGPSTVPCECDT